MERFVKEKSYGFSFIKDEWRSLNAKEFHKVILHNLLNDFFKPFIYKKMSSLENIYLITRDTIFYNPSVPLNVANAMTEIFKSVPQMLQIQNKTCMDLINYVDQIETESGRKLNPPKIFFRNLQNSCAPDSILYILFFYDYGYFINLIEQSKKDNSLKKSILDLYYSGEWTGTVENLQKILTPYLENCRKENIKSGTEIWTILAKQFPSFDFPVLTKRMEEIGNTQYMATYLPFVGVADPNEFLPYNLKSNPQHIIYADDDSKPKNLKELGFKLEYDDYQLKAVLFFMNGHYTAAVKTRDHWWYYDDVFVGNNVKMLKNPESGIFSETMNKKAQILFYSRK